MLFGGLGMNIILIEYPKHDEEVVIKEVKEFQLISQTYRIITRTGKKIYKDKNRITHIRVVEAI